MDLGSGIRKALAKLTGAAVVDEAAIKELCKELQRVLITNDVSVRLVAELTKKIERRALEEKQKAALNLREQVVTIVYDELVALLGEKFEPKKEKGQRILMLGLFGAGKTTSVGKMAKYYQKQGLSVGVIAGDVHRPAAYEQLKQLSLQVKCNFYGNPGKSAKEIAIQGLENLRNCEVIIFDSAGRSAFDGELARELKDVSHVLQPTDAFLVVSADVGQVAGKQAEEFKKAVPVSGVIITKMDGSGKGGGALSSVHVTGSKVAFIGTGEKMEAIEPFDSKKFVARLVGFPDLESLLDKVKEATEEEAMAKVMETGELNYETFLVQMRAMKKMGPMKQILQMLGIYDIPEEMLGKSEQKLKKFEAIVGSMTKGERKNTELMRNKARQERVARGAGVPVGEVKELVHSFDNMSKMFKGMKKNKNIMKRFAGKMPPGFDMSKLGGLMGR